MRALTTILAEHGPLHEDDIARRLQEAGVTDPDAVLDALRLETECPAAQLDDDRWAWLPALLAGRVFSHRLGANEADYDLLAVTPDLDPITILYEHDQYRRLADGSTVQIALTGLDDELLEHAAPGRRRPDPAR